MIEYKQLVVPIALFFFVSIVMIALINMFFNYLNRRLALETIKVALKKEQPIDRELIEAIVSGKSNNNSDLRMGWLLATVACAFILLGLTLLMLGYKSIFVALLGMACFPGLLSMTYLMFYFKAKEKS